MSLLHPSQKVLYRITWNLGTPTVTCKICFYLPCMQKLLYKFTEIRIARDSGPISLPDQGLRNNRDRNFVNTFGRSRNCPFGLEHLHPSSSYILWSFCHCKWRFPSGWVSQPWKQSVYADPYIVSWMKCKIDAPERQTFSYPSWIMLRAFCCHWNAEIHGPRMPRSQTDGTSTCWGVNQRKNFYERWSTYPGP